MFFPLPTMHPSVSRTFVIVGLVGIILLFCITIFFAAAGKPSPALTVRHVKSVPSGNLVMLTFEITNHTAGICLVGPVSIEVRNGSVWSSFLHFATARTPSTPDYFLRSNEFMSFTLDVTNLPTTHPLRLRMRAHSEREKLQSLFVRFRLRAFEGQTNVSLNPFDKSTSFFGKGTPVLSDEFVEPESNQIRQTSSGK